jgi:hypothetical protein
MFLKFQKTRFKRDLTRPQNPLGVAFQKLNKIIMTKKSGVIPKDTIVNTCFCLDITS